jgi:hypothetical protein
VKKIPPETRVSAPSGSESVQEYLKIGMALYPLPGYRISGITGDTVFPVFLEIRRRAAAMREKIVSDEIKRIIISHCGPVLMGIKPAALFVVKSENSYACLGSLLPTYLSLMILRKSETGLLVFVFAREKLEQTIADTNIKTVLSGMGYPEGTSVFVFLDYLKNRFESRQFPHEIGLFLGYPVDDVLGFVKHKGENYKLCGYWKVYGDVEQAKLCFRQYDKCRKCLKAVLDMREETGQTAFPGSLHRMGFQNQPGFGKARLSPFGLDLNPYKNG